MNIIDLIVELIKSEFAKTTGVTAVLLVVVAGVSVLCTWLYLSKIHYKIQINNYKEEKKQNKKLTDENVSIKQENSKLQKKLKKVQSEVGDLKKKIAVLQFTIDTDENKDVQDDPALEIFTSDASKK